MPLKTLAALIAAFCIVAVSTQAEAKHRHHASHKHYTRAVQNKARTAVIFDTAAIPAYGDNQTYTRPSPMGRNIIAPVRSYDFAEGVIGGRPSGCPVAYCGCSASIKVFGRIIPELNLAANWRRFPSTSPAPGMAAWRWHHVFIIESVNGDGTVVAHDGNSGRGLTRLHTVSLRGYHVVNPNGSHIALNQGRRL